MKTIFLILIILLHSVAFGQNYDQECLLKKWYYYDSVIEPSNADVILFYSNEYDCTDYLCKFYWEFKVQGEYLWSDIIYSDTTNINIGVITVPKNKWKLKKNVLTLGSNKFIIDVLEEDFLLIHRLRE